MLLRTTIRSLAATALLIAASSAGAQSTAPALTFDDKGAKVGEQLPNFALRTVDDEPIDFASEVRGPTLIVTSSFTCPKSRSHYPELTDLATKYKDKLHVVILYVIEAHPAGDPSPYREGKEDVTVENERDGVLRRQPTTFDKRLTLANAFKDRLAIKIPILVDGMENWAWKSVGAGPNMAILVDSKRVVRGRQGWFDAAKLIPEIDALFAEKNPPLPRGPFRNETDAALNKKLVEDKILQDTIFQRADAFFDEKPAGKLAGLLKKYPGLVSFALGYSGRGDEGGETLLQSAVREARLDAVKTLLAAGADPDMETPWRESAVYLAAAAGNEDILKLLLAKSRDVDYRLRRGPKPLQISLLNDHPAAAKLLIAAGAKETLYTRAAMGDTPVVSTALAKDESIAGRPDGAGNTLLDYAAATGQIAVINLLLAVQPSLPRLGMDEDAVTQAVNHNHADSLAAILAAGGNPDVRAGDWYDSALHSAVSGDHAELVGLLLNAHAKPDVTNILGQTPLLDAAALGYVNCMKLLIDGGANINFKSGEESLPCGPPGPTAKEETALQHAAGRDQLEAVKLLLERHADVSPEDVTGKTALDYAKDDSIKKLLRAAGAKAGSGKQHEPVRSREP